MIGAYAIQAALADGATSTFLSYQRAVQPALPSAPSFEELQRATFRDMVKEAYKALKAEGVKDRQMCDGQIFMWLHDAYGFKASRADFKRMLIRAAEEDPEIQVSRDRSGILYVKVRSR
ncbi:MAG TPA: hypothetical protein ENF34_01615 [Candidatus Bathyarchaeota archaeon]|nr:hypothetical protein [Candidatus Bathyarchaeota archaeon]